MACWFWLTKFRADRDNCGETSRARLLAASSFISAPVSRPALAGQGFLRGFFTNFFVKFQYPLGIFVTDGSCIGCGHAADGEEGGKVFGAYSRGLQAIARPSPPGSNMMRLTNVMRRPVKRRNMASKRNTSPSFKARIIIFERPRPSLSTSRAKSSDLLLGSWAES